MAAVLATLALAACGGKPASAPEEPLRPPTPPEASWFREITTEVGLDFHHDSGVDGSYYFPEHLGSGGALFDYDQDGDLDLYLVNSGPHAEGDVRPGTENRLFRQEADGRLVDRTVAAGVGDTGYGMGAAVGDIDNDGDPDLYVTNYGPDVLYRNEGDGSFRRWTAEAGIRDDAFSTSACFLDFDDDHLLDLFVATYVHHDPASVCTDTAGRREYCGPAAYRGQPDLLYRNLGGGRFREVGAAAGIQRLTGKGLGVLCSDLDGDGRTDVYVTNDGEKNDLWINRGDGSFEDRAVLLGAAFNSAGQPEASMGVAVGDVDGDLDLDLFMSHLDRETNTLYRSLGGAAFRDDTAGTGVGAHSLPFTGFGAGFFDPDNDGDLDLLIVNGRVRRIEVADRAPELGPGPPSRQEIERFWADYAEPNLLMMNDGGGRFTDASERAGDLCLRREVSRGLVFGDFDLDGWQDVLVSQCNAPARLFRNEMAGRAAAGAAPRWVEARALEGDPPRDALGGVVSVATGAGAQVRPLASAYSYLSAAEPGGHFGLGSASSIDRLDVRWPDGRRSRWIGLGVDRRLRVYRRPPEALP